MLNNIIELYFFEFKRIKKLFLFLLLIFISINLFLFAKCIIIFLNISEIEYSSISELLKNIKQYSSSLDFNIISDYSVIYLADSGNVFKVFICILFLYSFIIWYKDFYLKEKTSYTLFLLPQNRMNIFYSKLLVVLNTIYTFLILQIINYVLYTMFIKNYFNLDINLYTLYSLSYSNSNVIDLFSKNIIIYFLVVFCVVTSIFMCIIKSIYNKKKGFLDSIVLISLFLTTYLSLEIFGSFVDIFVLHTVYLIILIIFNIFVSSKFINKIDF